MHPILSPVRERLQQARDAGESFDDAWTAAIAATDQSWRPALAATRDQWEAAYERDAHPRCFTVLATIASEGALGYWSHLPAGPPGGGLHHAARR